ncbi:hypothetical protein IJ556_04065 [bacterium]|nr:hypothetical protein [bacterium]
MKENGTHIGITLSDKQSFDEIINKLICIGVPSKLINFNQHNFSELILTVNRKAKKDYIDIVISTIRGLVSPAEVKMFVSYINDIGAEERVYYCY